MVKILDSGNVEPGQFGDQHNFKIKTRNGEKKIALNQKTLNVLGMEYGTETEAWIGKEVNVILKKDVIGGKKVIIAYLVTEGWSLDDYGDLSKLGVDSPEVDLDEAPF